MSKAGRLAARLLADRDRAREREGERIRRERAPGIEFDPFQTVDWRHIAGPDPGYMPRTAMRMGRDGFWVRCKACGVKFESKGWGYCWTCLALPADERRQVLAQGRPCEGPGCDNVIAPSARVDARFCSGACRERARASRQENGGEAALPVRGQNLTATPEILQQKQDAKTEDQKRFDNLRGDARLSDWKPTGDAKGMPDIPEFLRR